MAGEAEGPTPQRSRDELINRFVELSNEVSSQMRPQALEVVSEIELTLHQFRALSLLSRGPMRTRDLAVRLGIRPSSAANIVQSLGKKNLLECVPDPEEPRTIWCRLTPLGMQEMENLWNLSRQSLESVIATLSDQELRTVVETFEILSSALRRDNSSTRESRSRTL